MSSRQGKHKKQRSSRKRGEQERSYKRWSLQENIIYAKFLQLNKESFDTEWSRRSKKVFLGISTLVQGKTVNQCKSHHQKMFRYCGSIDKIILKFLYTEKKIDERNMAKDSMDPDMDDENKQSKPQDRFSIFQALNQQCSQPSQSDGQNDLFDVMNPSQSDGQTDLFDVLSL